MDGEHPPSSPTAGAGVGRGRRIWHTIRAELNFFRLHLLFFIATPLIFSGILFAVNGRFRISYIDCLFNSVSAMTVTGLATINLSELTPLQQVILFVQMCLGSPVFIAWIVVYVRRHYFQVELHHIVERARKATHKVHPPQPDPLPWHLRIHQKLLKLQAARSGKDSDGASAEDNDGGSSSSRERYRDSQSPNIRTGLIRRLTNDKPRLISPMGWVTPQTDQGDTGKSAGLAISVMQGQGDDGSQNVEPTQASRELDKPPKEADIADVNLSAYPVTANTGTRFEETGLAARRRTINFPRSRTQSIRNTTRPIQTGMSRSQTVEFSLPEHPYSGSTHPPNPRRASSASFWMSNSPYNSDPDFRRRSRPMFPNPNINTSSFPPRTATLGSVEPLYYQARHMYRTSTKDSGLGGFPGPLMIVSRGFSYLFPRVSKQLRRTTTIPYSVARPAPYVKFDAIVGRNSVFHDLTADDLDELGGVEYRALTALLWIVGIYHIGIQLTTFIMIAPYISVPRWASAFVPPALKRPVAPPWFALFQVVSAYTNTGMSLVDQSIVPFQQAYLMLFLQVFLILAGNTAFPIFLRLFVWMIFKIVPKKTFLRETLQFLLDHPRRCFLYLFPSHQTWFLLTILFILNFTDYFCFLVLDIGNPELEKVAIGTRFAIGVLQATAVRAAGFATIALSALAPAVKVLYVIMMYVSVYPIAMSVRSTNVYEEKSLGVYDSESEEYEPIVNPEESRTAVWGKYLGWHVRRQLAFDMWWLSLALFLICIIERGPIQDIGKPWFDIFTIIFEIVSAYGTVGLSLGVPYDNFSFSGSLKVLSKLIICIVMIRGRHRSLPVAIDRAIVIPFEFKKDHAGEDRFPRTRTQISRDIPHSPIKTRPQEDIPQLTIETAADSAPATLEHTASTSNQV